MVIDRRALMAGAGAAIAAGLTPRAADALGESETLVLAPARREDGSFAVLVFSERFTLIREIVVPARAHDLALHPPSGRAAVFARRPGTFAVAFDMRARTAPQMIVARPDRHFFGHGTFAADGKLLFATENAFDAGESVIGIYDATGAYRRIGEFPTHGIGAHEALLMPDGRTLAVANGGIETHPDFPRQKLNLPTMDPSLAFFDLDGHLVAQHSLPHSHHQLSIRHMAVGAGGDIWFGTQWEGDPRHTPPLVGRASPDGLAMVETPQRALSAMRAYVGSMAASRDGTMICASAPRGGALCYWSAETGRYLGRSSIADASGIAGTGVGRFLAASGEGVIAEAGPHGTAPATERPGIAFDNHLRIASVPAVSAPRG